MKQLELLTIDLKYTIDYFINKFEVIPSEKWGTGQLHHGHYNAITREFIPNGICCALGHCGAKELPNDFNEAIEEVKALCEIFGTDKGINPYYGVYSVNDYQQSVFEKNEYPGHTPKERILYQLKLKQNEQRQTVKTL